MKQLKFKPLKLEMKHSQTKLKKSARFVMDVGFAQMLISTAKGLR